MKTTWLRIVGVTVCLGMVAAFASPQEGLGKKKKGGGGSSGGSGGSSEGGSKPRNNEPPPRRSGGGSGGSGHSGGSRNSGDIFGGRTGGSTSGRPSDGRDTRGGDAGLSRRPTRTQSRSGNVRYGTTNNIGGNVRRERVQIGRAPARFDPELARRVRRQERVGIVFGNYRVGYVHYDRNWRDDYYCYPHYVFDPYAFSHQVNYAYSVFYSPWYYYASLPAYIQPHRVTIINVFPQTWEGTDYRWNRPNPADRYDRYEDLDYAIEDIVDSFQRGDRRAASKLIPRDGKVNIYMDGTYRYSLSPDDFYDLFMDGIDNTRTSRYDIVSVRSNGRDAARVVGRHEYEDPWGKRSAIEHTFLLERERRDIVIREFGITEGR